MYKKSLLFLIIFSLLFTAGFGCKRENKAVVNLKKPIALDYWRVWDDTDAFSDIITRYKQRHPFVTINYRKLRYDEYENELIEAFATDRGPDIFSIHNTWIRKYQSKGLIEHMPTSIQMVYPVIKGSIKKEVVYEQRTTKSITLKQLKDKFVDSVYGDVVVPIRDAKSGKLVERVYGLPLFIDTLAMYYNKDLFNNAGITNPPEFWDREFQQDVKKLTKQDNKGQLIQSGAALGGSDNIERSTDIITLLMMQNGTKMMENNGQVRFHMRPEGFKDKSYNPGLDALRFYTDFSNPAKEVYSWNKSLDNSIDMFLNNKLAIMFGYSYMLPQIKADAPKLNFSVTNVPQIEGSDQSINYANYWVESVSKKILTDPNNLKYGKDYAKQKFDTAWNFIQFLTQEEQAKIYLKKTKKPTALRNLVKDQLDDQDIGVFAEQVLTAKSWYHGVNANAMESIMNEMINEAIAGQKPLENIIGLSAKKVQQTINE